MRHFVPALALLAAVVAFAQPAEAQSVTKSTLSGVMVTKSVDIADSTAAPVYTTPASTGGFFILTQYCTTNPGPGSVTLSAANLGQIVVSTNDECTTYSPGIAIPAASAITCTNEGTGSTESCMITGILSKK